MRVLTITALFILGLAYPGFAGYTYKSQTKTTSEGQKPSTVEVQAWVDGENAKILFEDSGANPIAKEGNYLVTKDAGQTMFLVNPKDKTYMTWSLDGIIKLAGGVMNAIAGIVSMEISDPKVELLEESSGDKIHGLATRRYKFRTTYSLNTKVFGMKQFQEIETVQEVHSTDQVKDLGFDVWQRKQPPTTGDESMDKLIQAEMSKVKGFPLRSHTKTVTREFDKKKTRVKKESVSYSEMEVTEWRQDSIAADTFEIPAGYERVATPADSSEEGNPFKGIFGKKN